MRLGRKAAARAAAVAERESAPAIVEIAGHVRSTAVDLVRAAELVASAAPAPEELATEELLLAPS
jgi:histone H3/H4